MLEKKFPFDLQRFSIISNSTSNTVVNGTSDNDSIYNESTAETVTIDGGAGDDTINNNGADYVTIYGGAGNDSIINNEGDYAKIYGEEGNDYVYSDYGWKVTVDGGAGKDTLISDSGVNSISVYGGEGDDSIINYSAWYSTIGGGKGNDTISVSWRAWEDILKGGAGNDQIMLSGTIDTANGGNTVIGGNGNDTIYGNANYATIGNVFVYNNGDGKDLIYNWNAMDTLQIGGSYSSQTSGSNIIITVGDGKMTLVGASGKTVNIKSTNAIYLQDSYSSVAGSSGNDSIVGDYYAFQYSTIDAGAGNDTVMSYGDYNSINGGAGSDLVSVASLTYSDTINGGKGNDTIYGNNRSTSYGHTYQYANGDGYDLIYNYGSADTVVFTSGSYSKSTVGSDVILTAYNGVTANGAITLSGAAGKTINVKILEEYSWTLDGTTAKYGTSSKTLCTVKGVKSVDGLSVNGKVVTVANSSLNKSKVTISGTGYTLKLASDVTKTSTKKAAWSYANSTATYKSSYKTAGYSLTSSGKSISYTKATSVKTLATIKGAKSKKGLKVSGKKIVLPNSALNKKVTISGSYAFDFAAGYKNATISGTASADTITARGSNISIIGGKGKDSIKMVGSNQTVSGGDGADTFIYAANGGSEKITDFSANDTLKIGAEGTGTYSTATSGKNVIVTIGKGEVTLVGAAGKSLHIAGETTNEGVNVSKDGTKITLTSDYSEKSFSLAGNYSSALTVDASAVTHGLKIVGNDETNEIIGSKDDDTLNGGAGADTIKGGKGSDSIFGGKGDDELHGGLGNDTLWGGAGNDELYGDDGNDVFYYNAGEGNDTIYGYTTSVDKIVLGSGTISNVNSDKNNNVIFHIGSGQLVINNAADRTVKVVDVNGDIVAKGLYEG